jgi:hypothetical protein
MFGLDGFRFRETMAGTWTRVGDGSPVERAISFTVTARAQSWLKHLRDHQTTLEGSLQMDGFASGRPIAGTLYINPLLERVIRYEFGFTGDDGKPYRFRGQKDVSLTDLVGSMTTLPATIADGDGKLVANALLKFDTNGLPGFLASFRPG